MNLDKRVQTLESRTDLSVEPVTTIEIVGVPCASDGAPGTVLTCALASDRYFTTKTEASA